MTLAEVLSDSSTPPPAQKQVIVVLAEFLLSRYGPGPNATRDTAQDDPEFARRVAGRRAVRRDKPPDPEPAFGIWADRPEVADSAGYVDQLRARRRRPGKWSLSVPMF